MDAITKGTCVRWFISDTHFGHFKCLEYGERPFQTVEEADEAMISRWNAVVGKDDMVFHLGDVSICSIEKTANIMKQLNGCHTLILGNHDRSVSCMHRVGFSSVVESCHIRLGGFRVQLIHNPDFSDPGYCEYVLHGHVHQKWKINGNWINLSVEVWDYTPVSEVQLVKLIRRMHNGTIKEKSTYRKTSFNLNIGEIDASFNQDIDKFLNGFNQDRH